MRGEKGRRSGSRARSGRKLKSGEIRIINTKIVQLTKRAPLSGRRQGPVGASRPVEKQKKPGVGFSAVRPEAKCWVGSTTLEGKVSKAESLQRAVLVLTIESKRGRLLGSRPSVVVKS